MLGGPDILWGGFVPGLVAAATFALTWRLTGRAASAWRTALVGGFVTGLWTLSARDLGATALMNIGQLEAAGDYWAYDPRNFRFLAAITKSYHPTEARDWLPLLVVLAIVPDSIACVSKLGPAIGWVLRSALCVFLPWRLLYGSSYLPLSLGPGFDFDLGGWSTSEAITRIGGIGAALLAVWQLTRMAAQPEEKHRGSIRSVLAMAVVFGSVITLVASGSLIYGQLLGVLTATLGGCGLASALLATRRGPDAAAGPIVVAFGTLLVAGYFYAELTLGNAALLLIAMVVAIGWLPLPSRFSPRCQVIARSLACLAILAMPVVPSVRELAGQVPDTETSDTESSDTQTDVESNPYDTFSR